MQFTSVRSKEKDYDIYLKSEVHSQKRKNVEVEKTGSCYFELDKHCCSYLEKEKDYDREKKWICYLCKVRSR